MLALHQQSDYSKCAFKDGGFVTILLPTCKYSKLTVASQFAQSSHHVKEVGIHNDFENVTIQYLGMTMR